MLRQVFFGLSVLLMPLLVPAVTIPSATSAPMGEQPTYAYDATPVQGVTDNVLTDSDASVNAVPSFGQGEGRGHVSTFDK